MPAHRISAALLALSIGGSCTAAGSELLGGELLGIKRGHAKAQYLLGTYPDDSLLRDAIGTPSHDINGELRLLIGGGANQWHWQGDYQAIARSGDTLELSRIFSDSFLVPGATLEDDRRLMDLTHVISDSDNSVVLHRLDRLHLGYTGDKTVIKVGRQAVSWGNGLLYNPLDFFNPFDPAAVDKEFKNGDDMLYSQYLQDNGNDWEFVSVWRRDEDGHTGNAVNSNSLKYHAFIGERELDAVVAQHYEDEIYAIGGVSNWGGAVLRADLVITHTDKDTYTSAVANVSYSWTVWDKNMSGVLEYFYNGLGLKEDDYASLPEQTDLLARLNRGETYTIGRNYLAGGLTIEITPLINLSPNLFINLGDSSGLLQLVGQYDLQQNWQLLLAANAPFGSAGTEYGGLDTPVDNRQFSTGPSLFAQIAFYF